MIDDTDFFPNCNSSSINYISYSRTIRMIKDDLDSLSLEEIMLLRESVEDRLQENPLDSSANSRYNIYSQIIEERLAKLYA